MYESRSFSEHDSIEEVSLYLENSLERPLTGMGGALETEGAMKRALLNMERRLSRRKCLTHLIDMF